MATTGERAILIETITRRVLEALERTVVTREMALEVLRDFAGEEAR